MEVEVGPSFGLFSFLSCVLSYLSCFPLKMDDHYIHNTPENYKIYEESVKSGIGYCIESRSAEGMPEGFCAGCKVLHLAAFHLTPVIVLFLEANIHGMEGAIGIARAYAKSQGIHVSNETGST